MTQKLRAARVTLLNQAVLLHRINDSLAAQVELAEALFDAGVLPYYLNQLDKVSGSAHFAVSDQAARALYTQMREALPGFLLPRLVVETAGASSKLPI
jgi:L-lysine 2,3-aminomutase